MAPIYPEIADEALPEIINSFSRKKTFVRSSSILEQVKGLSFLTNRISQANKGLLHPDGQFCQFWDGVSVLASVNCSAQ
jgi:hypothetical protein